MKFVKLADKRKNWKRKVHLANVKCLTKDRKGTTLVETMVTLFLISIMMAMAASALSSASRIFVRIQKAQYAQSILDTTMTELRTITKDASGYVKIYGVTGVSGGTKGNSEGYAIEFLTPEGYVELVSTEGIKETDIYIADNKVGTAESVAAGRLVTRYYLRNSSNGQYAYKKNGNFVARAAATVFGEGFYMGNYVQVEYKLPDGVNEDSKVERVTATVTVYTGCTDYGDYKEYKNPIATDTEVLEFRNPLNVKLGADSITAVNE